MRLGGWVLGEYSGVLVRAAVADKLALTTSLVSHSLICSNVSSTSFIRYVNLAGPLGLY